MGIQFYSSATCTGLKSHHWTPAMTTQNAWKKQTLTVASPAGAKSALVRLQVVKNQTFLFQPANGTFSVLFDDVQVTTKFIVGPAVDIIDDVLTDTNPDNDPTPTPQPEDPQDDPTPTPQPEDPQDDPTPTPTPQPQDEPADEEPETTEEDIPDQEVPDLPTVPADEEPSDEPAGEAPSGNNGQPTGGNGQPANNSDEADAPANEEAVEGDVQTLSEAEAQGEGETSKPSKQQGKGSAPTPAAPEAGNASNEDNGLLGSTELAIAGAAGLALVGLAFMAGSRRGRKQEERYLPFE
jgi:hypothetical protein